MSEEGANTHLNTNPEGITGHGWPVKPRTSRFRTALCSLRQLLYRKPFRIPRPNWPDYWADIIAHAEGALIGEADTARKEVPKGRPGDSDGLYLLMADVVTSLWRARKRMLPDGAVEPSEALRPAYRHIASAWDALASAHVEVKDHTGERYVTGMALKVAAFQPTQGLTHETVLETIKPSVFHGDALIQRGEVIVGTPAAPRDEGISPAAGNGAQARGSTVGDDTQQRVSTKGESADSPKREQNAT